MEEAQTEEKVEAAKQPILSQRDYVPTPFQLSAWELVGERLKDFDFAPLEISVIRSQKCDPDPMFEDFGSPIPRDVESMSHDRDQEVEEEEETPVIDEAVLEEARAQAREEGRLEGFQEGEDAAKSALEERFQEIQWKHAELGKGVQNQMATVLARVEKNAVALALQIAKKILQTTAEVKPDYIIDVVRKALTSTGAGKPLRIRVSPDDHEFLEVIGLPAELSTEETGVEYVSDETVRSGCVVETDFGEVDLQLEKMWEQVRESLYEASK